MTQLLKDKADKYNFKDQRKGDRIVPLKKNDKPGPTDFKIAEAQERTSAAALRKSYRHFFEREKRVSHICKLTTQYYKLDVLLNSSDAHEL